MAIQYKGKQREVDRPVAKLAVNRPRCVLTPLYVFPNIRCPKTAFYAFLQRVGRQVHSKQNASLGVNKTPIKTKGSYTQVHKALNRDGCEENVAVHDDFRRYAAAVIDEFFPTMTEDEADLSYSSFLKNSNRSREYIEKLHAAVKEEAVIDELFAFAFIKEEAYAEDKFARVICALSDNIKVLFGPIFRAIDKTLFSRGVQSKFFVKNVPVKERPGFIEQELGTGPVVVGDFSSFECCHAGVFSQAVKRAFFKILGQGRLPTGAQDVLAYLLSGQRYVRFKAQGIKGFVQETLMSGAPWTSSANAILNLLVCSFMRLRELHPSLSSKLLAKKFPEFKGLFEGDDSIVCGGPYDIGLVVGLGLPLTSQAFENYSRASFCGIVRPLSVNACLCDPIKVVCNFFVLPSSMINSKKQKQDAYLRAKALSYFYQYDTCPVVAHLAKAVLDRTTGVTISNVQLSYNRQAVLKEAMESGGKFWHNQPNVHPESRVLVEELFGLSTEVQLYLEDCYSRWGKGESVQVVYGHEFDRFIANGLRQLGDGAGRPVMPWTSNLLDPELIWGMWYLPYLGRAVMKTPGVVPGKWANIQQTPDYN